jgi:poly(A) polymerase
MPGNPLFSFPLILDSIRATLPDGLTVYLVGGAVRDALLGRPIHDLDFVLERDAIRTARRVANLLPRSGKGSVKKADFYPLDNERDTGRVIVTHEDGTHSLMDFAAFRGPDLEADIQGRDFTLNAIAIQLNDNTIHDPLGGALDLKEKRLKACSPSTFSDDPVRILRGVRLAANFGFHIHPETRKAMKAASDLIGNTSPERMRDELFRLLDGRHPAACLRALDMLGALEKILPEINTLKGVQQTAPHVHNLWEHTLATVRHLEDVLDGLSLNHFHETTADYHNGLMALRIGRFRQQVSELYAGALTADRSLRSLLFLSALYHDAAKPQMMKGSCISGNTTSREQRSLPAALGPL